MPSMPSARSSWRLGASARHIPAEPELTPFLTHTRLPEGSLPTAHTGDISLIEANDAASYVQELAGDDANIIFGAMYDENAQDEATITVIATGLDSHGVNTPVAKAMTEFKTPFKAKTTGNTYAQPAAQTAAAAQPTYKAPTFRAPSAAAPAQPVAPKEAPQSAPAQPFRPMRQETQINIPDFLRNKK